MANSGRLLWFTNTQQDDRERRLLDALSSYRPLVSRLQENATQFNDLQPSDTVVLNLKKSDAGSSDLIEELRRLAPKTALLLRTHNAAEMEALVGGGNCVDSEDDVELAKRKIAGAVLAQRNEYGAVTATAEWRKGLVGESLPMQKVAEVIRLVGPRKVTVLITGETGTGKEVVAQAIHRAGPRAGSPFVAVNCSAIPATLLEAELFGHIKGAFTGATQTRAGRFEEASDGTLFLDEVGELPVELQAKLLRVLQEREFQRLGSSETVRVDVRVIAATNCDLRAKVRAGSFREDLLYRLNVVPLELPPLRARRGDIRLLTEHFLNKVCRDEQLPGKQLTPQAWTALHQQAWPGNVRQLENAVASAVILSENRKYLDADDFASLSMEMSYTPDMPFDALELPEHGFDYVSVMSNFERKILSEALRKTGGNKKQAAEMLGLKRTTLSAKVRVLEETQGLRLA